MHVVRFHGSDNTEANTGHRLRSTRARAMACCQWSRKSSVESRSCQPSCVFCGIAAQEDLLHADDVCFAFHDRAPAASFHLLVCSRAHIRSVSSLAGPADAVLSAHLLRVASQLLQQLAPGEEHVFGYHVPPFFSVPHLHLHALSLPWRSPWRHLKYSTVFGGVLHFEPAGAAVKRIADECAGGQNGSPPC